MKEQFEPWLINGEEIAIRSSKMEDFEIHRVDDRLCLFVCAEGGYVSANIDLKDVVKYIMSQAPEIIEEATIAVENKRNAEMEEVKAFAKRVGYEVGGWVDANLDLPDVEKIVQEKYAEYAQSVECAKSKGVLEHKKNFGALVGKEVTKWIDKADPVPDITKIVGDFLGEEKIKPKM